MIAMVRHFIARLRALVRGSELDRDFSRELETHLEMMTEDHIRRGLSPAEARRQAAIRLGAASSLQSQHRDARGFRALDDLFQDLRFAARLLIKDRWFSAAAIAAIALGIGANTIGFSIVNAAFIRGFAFDRAEDLLAISWRPQAGRRTGSSHLDFEDWRTQSQSFESMAAYGFGAMNISDDHAAPEQTQGSIISANFFDMLRQRPLLGRTFIEGEERRASDLVVIIGYDIWTNRFGRDPNILGHALRVNGKPSTIVGVMPEGMKFPDNSELWAPFGINEAQSARNVRPLGIIGRLKPGVSRREAQTEIDGIAKRSIAAHPEENKGLAGGQVETLLQRFLGGAARPMFITIMGAVIFVLLIACANVANLLLSRALYRSREVAVRYSLGATRWRIVRQLLIESVALAGLGGLIGLAFATFGVRAFDAAVQASQAPYWLRFTIDYRVLAYVAGTCVATGVLFGLAPALHISREQPADTLKDGARGMTGGGRSGRLGNGLVIAELALTVVLLCGAGLMVRSFMALYAIDPGFEVNGLTRMRMQLPPAKYPDPASRARLLEQLQPLVAAIPGVQHAAFATSVPPLRDEEWRFELDGDPPAEDTQRAWTSTIKITPHYFDLLGVSINRGRALNASDGSPGAENVIVNQMFVDRYLAGRDPIGRRIKFVPRRQPEVLATDAAFAQSWRTIVGVSAPFIQGSTDDAFRSPVVYLPLREFSPRTVSLMVRSALPPGSVMTEVRKAMQSIDVDQPVFTIQTIAQVFAEERSIYRIFATLFAVLAAIGLLLSAIGVYGVMAYAISRRTQEIGLRMALGARRWDVSWLFLRRGLVQLAVALAIGLPAALGLASVAQFRLVEIEPSDPVTMIGITIVIVTVALLACVLPARRAARVDPMVALRAE